MTDKKIQMAATLLKDGRARLKDVCGTLGVSKATLYSFARDSVTPYANSDTPGID